MYYSHRVANLGEEGFLDHYSAPHLHLPSKKLILLSCREKEGALAAACSIFFSVQCWASTSASAADREQTIHGACVSSP